MAAARANAGVVANIVGAYEDALEREAPKATLRQILSPLVSRVAKGGHGFHRKELQQLFQISLSRRGARRAGRVDARAEKRLKVEYELARLREQATSYRCGSTAGGCTGCDRTFFTLSGVKKHIGAHYHMPRPWSGTGTALPDRCEPVARRALMASRRMAGVDGEAVRAAGNQLASAGLPPARPTALQRAGHLDED